MNAKLLRCALLALCSSFTAERGNAAVPVPAAADTSHVLRNISSRARVGTGSNPLIGGFIIQGDSPKSVLLRAIGPSLNISGTPIAGRLSDPTMELYVAGSNTPIRSNDNWRDTQQTEIAATGLQPADGFEAAIAATLAPGSYTAIVRGRSGGTGLGLVEVYETSNPSSPVPAKLANLSARASVGADANILIGGVIVGGAAETSSISVVARAIGPSLSAAGISDALPDPTLELVDANGGRISFNDNWEDEPNLELQRTGLAPTNPAESVISVQLAAGNYTFLLRGKNQTGTALVEIYDVPPPSPGS